MKYLMLLLITTLSLTFTACGGDDDKDEPDQPSYPTTDIVKGKTSFPGIIGIEKDEEYFCQIKFGNYNNNSNSDDYMQKPEMGWKDGALTLYTNNSSYWGRNLKVIYVGTVNSLNEIRELPTPTKYNTWNKGKTLFEKGGYVIEGSSNGDLYYVRLYISAITYNAQGEKVGVSYEYQFFDPLN